MIDKEISIALTTYNGEKYLQAQLNSFVAQTIQPSELIICDDGSTDNTLNILEVFKAQASFSVLIYKNVENLGYAQNFSKALSLCSGDIVFLSDQDDVWHTNKIEAMLAMFEVNPKVQLLIHDLAFCNAALVPTGQTKLARLHAITNPMQRYVTGMATAVRAPFLKLCLPIPQNITHDVWLHQCANVMQVKEIMPNVLADYRRHDANATITSALNRALIKNNADLTPKHRHIFVQDNLHKQLHLQMQTMQWLTVQKEALLKQCITLNSYQALLDLLAAETNAIRARLAILSKPRLMRVMPILHLYISGGYAWFNGFKSAAKDALLLQS